MALDGEPTNERRCQPEDDAGRLAELVLRHTGEYQDGTVEVLAAGYHIEQKDGVLYRKLPRETQRDVLDRSHDETAELAAIEADWRENPGASNAA